MAEVAPIISDLAVILIIAGIVTVVFKWLKQPVILGYIVAGLLAGPSIALFPTVTDMTDIKTWGDIGVIFLLFSMGLGFSFKKLMNVGLTAVVATMTIVLRHDIRRIHGRTHHGLLAHELHFPGRHDVYVLYGHCL